MIRRSSIAISLTAFALTVATVVGAANEPTTDAEFKCRETLGKQATKIGVAYQKCITKCHKKTPQSPECSQPYGGETLACIQAAQAKGFSKMSLKCQSDGTDADSCPECHEEWNSFGTCAAFQGLYTTPGGALATAVDLTLAYNTYCDDSSSPDGLTPVENKCRTRLAKALATFGKKMRTCLTRCLRRERDGVADGNCAILGWPSQPTDTVSNACLVAAEQKLLAKAAKCDDPPECYGGSAQSQAAALVFGVMIPANPLVSCDL